MASGRVGCHSDGRLSMVEALRETVCSEIVAAELPWGAVPVVAVIDAGTGEGDAILVRPTFARPAHFERSIYFGRAGLPGSEQHLDALRVREMVELAEHVPEQLGFPGIGEMFARFARQLGVSQARRLWQGKFLSSNACVTGALADFGSYRAVPSWHAYYGKPEERFGTELQYLEMALDSVVRSFRKYGAKLATETAHERLRRSLPQLVEDGFAADIVSSLGLKKARPASQRRVSTLLRDYWISQQRHAAQIAFAAERRLPWIHDALVSERPAPGFDAEERLVSQILDALASDVTICARDVLTRLCVWSCPRWELSYERTAGDFTSVVHEARRSVDPGAEMARAVDFALSHALRRTSDLPPGWALDGQNATAGSSVRYLSSMTGDGTAALVAGTVTENGTLVFGRNIADASVTVARQAIWLLPCEPAAVAFGFRAEIAGWEVDIPPASHLFPRPAERWSGAASATLSRSPKEYQNV